MKKTILAGATLVAMALSLSALLFRFSQLVKSSLMQSVRSPKRLGQTVQLQWDRFVYETFSIGLRLHIKLVPPHRRQLPAFVEARPRRGQHLCGTGAVGRVSVEPGNETANVPGLAGAVPERSTDRLNQIVTGCGPGCATGGPGSG